MPATPFGAASFLTLDRACIPWGVRGSAAVARELLVISGPDQGRVFPLADGGTLSVGRDPSAAIRLQDTAVARLHCRLSAQTDRVLVADFDSQGGTFVNDQRVEWHDLKLGDVLQVGQTRLRLSAGAQPVSAGPSCAPAGEVPLSEQALSDLTGQPLAQYRVGRLLARSRTGIVFLARDTRTEAVVALKVLWPEVAADAEGRRRLLRAMQTVMPLRHPNLVTVHDAGKAGPHRWVAMEYVTGASLAETIKRTAATAVPVAGPSRGSVRGWWRFTLRVAVHVGRALHFLHGSQVLHRNVTPGNILVRDGDNVGKLAGLSLAKAMAEPPDVTQPGELLGDVRYLAPEQTDERAKTDARSDLYALGASAYALLAGRPPFVAKSLRETLTLVREAAPVPPTEYQPAMPAAFEQALLKLLAKRPADRFQTAAELIRRLEQLAKTEGVGV
jgi:serine/threonine-protein kinase